MPLYFKPLNFYSITMPPAVSALSEQTATINESLEAAIDMSNLMLKYIPTEGIREVTHLMGLGILLL